MSYSIRMTKTRRKMKSFYKKMLFLEAVVLYVMFLLVVVDSSKQEEIQKKAESKEVSLMEYSNEQDGSGDAYIGEKKKVALTFDDGPDPEYTEALLDGLKQRGVKVTFFLTGSKAEKYSDIVKRIDEEGHLIGNHTYTHMQLHNPKREEFKEELRKTNDVITKITGKSVEYVRPPYGTWDATLEPELDMFPVFWNIDPLDWCRKDVPGIVGDVIHKVQDNDIILMHDQYETTVIAALQIVDELQRQGYEFVTVEELLLE